jgi:DNA-binding NarL/FixJ family response regulator
MSAGPNLIRILAVDDHFIFREGIVGLLADQADMQLVAEASNGREAIQQFRTHRPDDFAARQSFSGRSSISTTGLDPPAEI